MSRHIGWSRAVRATRQISGGIVIFHCKNKNRSLGTVFSNPVARAEGAGHRAQSLGEM